MSDDTDWTITPTDRAAAHAALERWLDECPREAAAAFASGRMGYLGRLKLCAFRLQWGVSLRIERSFSEDL